MEKEGKKRYARALYASWEQGTFLYGRWASSRGLHYSELQVLYALNTRSGLTQKTISEYYGLPKQTVNAVVQNLRKQGYVVLQKSGRDGREKIVELTREGEIYCNDLLKPLFDIEERVCGNIEEERFIQAIETEELFNLLFERELEKELKKELEREPERKLQNDE